MISTFTDLLPYIMPRLRSCPENLAALALREVSRLFFGVTEVWQKGLEPIDIIENVGQYALDPAERPGSGENEPEIRRIFRVRISGSEQSSSTYSLTPNTLVPSTTTYSITFGDAYVPTTSSEGGLEVDVVLVPDWNSAYLPTYHRNRWGEALVAGTLARLQLQDGVPWANPNEGREEREKFYGFVSTAIKERYTGRVGGTLQAGSPHVFDI